MECFSYFHHLLISLSISLSYSMNQYDQNPPRPAISFFLLRGEKYTFCSIYHKPVCIMLVTLQALLLYALRFTVLYSHYHSFHHPPPLPQSLTIAPRFHYSFRLWVRSLCSSPAWTLPRWNIEGTSGLEVWMLLTAFSCTCILWAATAWTLNICPELGAFTVSNLPFVVSFSISCCVDDMFIGMRLPVLLLS